jgi:hypothetical protein
MKDERKVVIVPCSGIGKTYGTVSREAAYDLVEDLRPDNTQLVALSLLVLGDEAARAAVAASPAITIDGLCDQNGAGERRDCRPGLRRAGRVSPLSRSQAAGHRRAK